MTSTLLASDAALLVALASGALPPMPSAQDLADRYDTITTATDTLSSRS